MVNFGGWEEKLNRRPHDIANSEYLLEMPFQYKEKWLVQTSVPTTNLQAWVQINVWGR